MTVDVAESSDAPDVAVSTAGADALDGCLTRVESVCRSLASADALVVESDENDMCLRSVVACSF